MKYIITYILVLFINSLISQNLIPNPSFEDYKYCPEYIGNFNDNVSNWSTSTLGTTDYFNICSETQGFNNYNGQQRARTGNGYAGIYVYSADNYREYIQSQLKNTLNEGDTYQVTFYISLAETSTHAIKGFKVLFTSHKLSASEPHQIKLKKLEKQAIGSDYIDIPDERFYSNKSSWQKVTVNYTAKGFEKYMTIGNFDSNRKLKKLKVSNANTKPFSYYYIDDVNVELLQESAPTKIKKDRLAKKLQNKEIVLEPEKMYTFKNVLFDFNRASLLDMAIEELDKLYSHLIKNKALNIEIYGHTDSSGLQRQNKILSTERAKAVSDYLILKGLAPKRIKWFGFGSSNPLTDNTSEENRALNRRVEFKLISDQ